MTITQVGKKSIEKAKQIEKRKKRKRRRKKKYNRRTFSAECQRFN